MKHKLLITGVNGRIGKIILPELEKDYEVYGTDIDGKFDDEKFSCDLSDFGKTKEIFLKVKPDFVVHLAGQRMVEETWESVLKNNIIATRNVFECSRLFGVKRVIYASSNHVTGMYENDLVKLERKIRISDPLRPDSYYGTSKIFGEALARQFFEIYNLSAICLRIGTVREDNDPTKDETGRQLKTWLSHRDLIQLIMKSLSSKIGFGVYYAISKNKGAFWDIENAINELNYVPEDDGSK